MSDESGVGSLIKSNRKPCRTRLDPPSRVRNVIRGRVPNGVSSWDTCGRNRSSPIARRSSDISRLFGTMSSASTNALARYRVLSPYIRSLLGRLYYLMGTKRQTAHPYLEVYKVLPGNMK